MNRIVIVGNGLAGHTAAAEIARMSPQTPLTVIAAEPGLPYDRPPLSKEYLLAEEPRHPALPQTAIYAGGVRLIEGVEARAIDRAGRRVVLSDGSSLPYDRLLLATGSRVRRLPDPAPAHPAIRYLRNIDDARALRSAMRGARRVGVLGGGFIGLEVAAAARQLGKEVVVIERMDRLLSRAASATLSDLVHSRHVARGVEVLLGAQVATIAERRGRLVLTLAEREIEVDLLLVGIGILPNTELAEAAGLAVDNGVVVGADCRTSDPDIFAAGEVTQYPLDSLGLRLRSESWNVAGAQARVAAQNMLGGEARFDELPWFWSDQYDDNIQSLGLQSLATRVLRIDDPAAGKWMRIGLDDHGAVVCAEAVNSGRDMSGLRRALKSGKGLPEDLRARAVEAGPDAGIPVNPVPGPRLALVAGANKGGN